MSRQRNERHTAAIRLERRDKRRREATAARDLSRAVETGEVLRRGY